MILVIAGILLLIAALVLAMEATGSARSAPEGAQRFEGGRGAVDKPIVDWQAGSEEGDARSRRAVIAAGACAGVGVVLIGAGVWRSVSRPRPGRVEVG